MAWTSSDTRYAVATACASVLALGVVALGTGFLSFPLIGVSRADAAVVSIALDVPDETASPTPPQIPIVLPTIEITPAPTLPTSTPTSTPNPPVPVIDAAPSVSFDNGVAGIAGSVSDDLGVSRVVATLTSSTGTTQSEAVLTCDAPRKSCTWSVSAAPGNYSVTARATDSSGRSSEATKTIVIGTPPGPIPLVDLIIGLL